MKILKLLTMLWMVVAMSAVATSCKDDDDDDDNSPLIGTWRESRYDDEYTFNSDGTYILVLYDHRGEEYIETGTYTYDHPTLICKYDEGTDVFTVKSISSTKLVLSEGEGANDLTYIKQ